MTGAFLKGLAAGIPVGMLFGAFILSLCIAALKADRGLRSWE